MDKELKTKTPEQALAALMRYASRAERSSGDAMRLMQRWGVAEGERRKILERLEQSRFIDDTRFAEAYVREKTSLSGWGVYKIRAGLRTKGIPAELAERALAAMDAAATDDRLPTLLERKASKLTGDTGYALKAKLIRFGLSRGFEYDAVIEAAEKVVKNE